MSRSTCSPVVSVLMTAYNAMPFLDDAVKSILEQSLRDIEFVIVNDGSSDQTAAYLDSIEDPRVKVFHEVNRGTAGASNFGLQFCTGKYVARMDADDISLETRLQEQVDFLEANPQVSLVGTQTRILGSVKSGIEVSLPLKHQAIDEALLTLKHGMAHGSCMFRRNLINELGGYWDLHRTYDDWDMFLRMGEKGELANLPKVLYLYRTLATSLVGSRLKEMRRYFKFSAERARRRRNGLPEISIEDFFQELDSVSWFQRVKEAIDVYTINQYRIATAEICGGKPFQGYCRIGWSAICAPGRTLNRIGRMLNVSRAKRQASHASN